MKLRPQTAVGSPSLRKDKAWTSHVQRLKQRPATALSIQSPNFKAGTRPSPAPDAGRKHFMDEDSEVWKENKAPSLAKLTGKYAAELAEAEKELSTRQSRLLRLETDRTAAEAMEESSRTKLEESTKAHTEVTTAMRPFHTRIATLKKEMVGSIKSQYSPISLPSVPFAL
eukprot:699468-Rhodomonas_salina.2